MDREFRIKIFVGFVKKVNQILQRGVVRGEQEYNFNSAFAVNCMGHSFFNFENEDIENLQSEYEGELRDYFWLFERFRTNRHHIPAKQLCKKAEEDLRDKIYLSGLDMEECSLDDGVAEGQFKVAYYFDFTPGKEGFHFIRQEKDGIWSSKEGWTPDVEKLTQLQKKYKNYELVKIFKVTNPYICKNPNVMEEENDKI